MAHGSQNPEWVNPFRLFRKRLEKRYPHLLICLSFLEFSTPNLAQVVFSCIDQSILDFEIWPLFMASGTHVQKDIPAIIDGLHVKHPSISWLIRPPLLEDEDVCQVLETVTDKKYLL